MLFNSFILARAKKNYLAVSSSVSNWSSKTWKRIITECPLDNIDSFGNGVITHFYGPDDQVIVGGNGFIPCMYDGDGRQSTPTANTDYAWQRTLKTCLLEPSTNALQYTGTDASLNSIYRTQSNSNFIAEFGVEFLTVAASTSMSFRFRTDGTDSNGYRVVVRSNSSTVVLEKVVSGSTTTVATGAGTQICESKMVARVKVIANGTSIKVYLNGELQINTTDASFSSGTHIGIDGQGNVSSQMRLLSIRSTDVVTISGLPKGLDVILRSDGKIPVARGYADANGQVTFTNNHWPLETIEISGVDYTPSGGIWGGDTIVFSGFSVTNTPQIISTL